jgi:uncharacterized protein
MRALGVLVVLTIAVPVSAATGPSFDCAQPHGRVQKLLCENEELATLDRTLAELLAATMKKSLGDDARKAERARQLAWQKRCGACSTSDDIAKCVGGVYEARIAELQVRSGSLPEPAPVTYQCGKDALRARFYDGTQLPVAMVDVGDLHDVAVAVPAASGVKYRGEHVQLWTKGEGATLTVDDKPDVTCTKKK